MNRKDVVSSIVSNITWSKIILIVTLAATVIGALVSTKILVAVNKNISAAKEAARPANVRIIKITTPNCQDCFNVDTAVNDFKKQNVKVEEEKTLTFDSPEASASIKEFAIKRVPAYIVSGEVSKNNLEGFVKNKIDSFKKAGVKITDTNEVVWNSFKGQKLINQYKITKVPTFILSSDIDFYDNVKSSWTNLGTVEQDKTYVARNLFLPYRDLEKNQILGLVDLIYLTDSSCSECYKADAVQKPILKQGYGVGIRSERTVDVSSGEGQGLISKYKITKVPTILTSPESDQYTNLKNVWKNVGTVELDGWYVFREMQQLRGVIYKDLTTSQIVGKVQSAIPSATPSETKQ
ncbi:MAG: hypothetical protein UT01_C0069G0005 [Candidatus Daviesbacteria bacterium GW2011_GWA1_38_7]|nr:MAG: hypothetical protein UT01_C0069G0005 [Candidatus Daviesbacteria bacterium GW2011_GWA1_38_7]